MSEPWSVSEPPDPTDPVRPNPTHLDPNQTQPNPTQPNPTRPDPTRPDLTQPNPTQPPHHSRYFDESGLPIKRKAARRKLRPLLLG